MAGLETLRFVLFGDDRASSVFSRFARQIDDTTKAVDKNNLSLVESRAKLDLIAKRAEELGKLNPDIKIQIDDAAAKLKLAVLRHDLRDTLGGGLLGGVNNAGTAENALSGLSKALSGLPGIFGSIASTGPVGVAVIAAMAAALVGLAAAAAPITAALIPVTIGIGGFAAIAIPELTKVMGVLGKTGTAAQTALKNLTPAEKALLDQIKPLKEQFSDLAKAVQPEVMKAFASVIKVIKDLFPVLEPLIKATGKMFVKFFDQVDSWLKSPGGQAFVSWLEIQGPKDIKQFGRVMWDIAKSIGEALNAIYRAGRWIDAFVGKWHDDWILVKTMAQIIWDQIQIGVLKTIQFILDAFKPLGFLDPFKGVQTHIAASIKHISNDVLRASNEWQNTLAGIHDEKVGIQFTSAFVASHGVPVAPAAKGMRVPGFGGGDRFPALLEGGEAVVPKHLTPAVAPFLKAHGVPGFTAGGMAGGGFFDVFSPSVAAEIRAINAGVKAFENAGANYVQSHPLKYWKFGQFGGVPGSVASYAGDVLRVLAMLGQPSVDVGVALRQMQTESGGNPLVVNRWDSNWIAGHPSVGLMQVIRGTFDAYAGPFRGVGPFEYGVSVNPMANIFAGLNYAVHRYGAAWTRVLGQGHGYDQGGWLPTGLSLAYNGTGRPERVGGGDVIINLNVQVGHGTNPRQAAKEIADILNQGATAGVRLRKSILSAYG